MNRRTFVKSALAFILGLLGLRFQIPSQQNKIESITLSPPAFDMAYGESYTCRMWVTTNDGKMYVTDISGDDGLPTRIWKRVERIT